LIILLVPSPVSLKLRTPVFNMGLRDMRIDALPMLVPEATANVNYFIQSRKNEIRFAGKTRNM